MKSFYQRTERFWVISRIVIVLMFMMQIISEGPLRLGRVVMVNEVCMVGTIMLAILAVVEVARGKKPAWLRICAGVFTSLAGLGLLVIMLAGLEHGLVSTFHLCANVLMVLVAIWFMLVGLRDFLVR